MDSHFYVRYTFYFLYFVILNFWALYCNLYHKGHKKAWPSFYLTPRFITVNPLVIWLSLHSPECLCYLSVLIELLWLRHVLHLTCNKIKIFNIRIILHLFQQNMVNKNKTHRNIKEFVFSNELITNSTTDYIYHTNVDKKRQYNLMRLLLLSLSSLRTYYW